MTKIELIEKAIQLTNSLSDKETNKAELLSVLHTLKELENKTNMRVKIL